MSSEDISQSPIPTPKKLAESFLRKQNAAKARMIKAMLDEDIFTVRYAAKRAKVHPTTHYDWLKVDPAYKLAIDECIENQIQRLEQSANERAVGIGIKTPSDLLTVFLLNAKRPSVYRPAVKGTVGGKDGQTITFTLSLGDAGGAS